MNTIHDTKSAGIALAVALALATLLGVGMLSAAAISFQGDTPDSAAVGSEVEVEEIVVEDLATVGDTWTMEVTTELEDPRLQVTVRDPGGNPIESKQYDVTDDTVTVDIDTSQDATVALSVRGDAPSIGDGGLGQFSYENPNREHVTALEVNEVFGGQTTTVDGGSFTVHRYTQNSRNAREAIDDASEAAEDADSDNARDAVDDAIVFYDNGEFQNAIDRANEAEDMADDSSSTRRLLMILAGILALVIVIGGAAYLWQSRQEPENKLR